MNLTARALIQTFVVSTQGQRQRLASPRNRCPSSGRLAVLNAHSSQRCCKLWCRRTMRHRDRRWSSSSQQHLRGWIQETTICLSSARLRCRLGLFDNLRGCRSVRQLQQRSSETCVSGERRKPDRGVNFASPVTQRFAPLNLR